MGLNFEEWFRAMQQVSGGFGQLAHQQALMNKARAEAERNKAMMAFKQRGQDETLRHNKATEATARGHLDIAREKMGQTVDPSVGRLLKGYDPSVAGPAQAYLLRQHAGQPTAQREAVFGQGRETVGPGGPFTLPPIGGQLARAQAGVEERKSAQKVQEKGRITGAQEAVKFKYKQKFARGKRTGYESHLDPNFQMTPEQQRENVPYTPSSSIKDPERIGIESQARGATQTQRAIQANVRKRGGYSDVTELYQYVESMKREGRSGSAEDTIPQALREMGVTDPQILSSIAAEVAAQDPHGRPAEWWEMTISGSF